jgi:hypothetical protein
MRDDLGQRHLEASTRTLAVPEIVGIDTTTLRLRLRYPVCVSAM